VPRTVFLGFDSMDEGLARRWAGEGLLPNFASVFESWPSLPMKHPEGLLVGGIWPEFWSERGPGHHASYCWRQFVPGTYTTELLIPTDFDTRPFWLDLDDAGVRCAIFDVPLVRPLPLKNGVHIVDWGSHDSQLDASVTDTGVASWLEALGPYPQKRCDITVEDHGHEELFDALRKGFAMRSTALSQLLSDRYDFVATVFAETHCTGHHFLHLHDTSHPRHDQSLRERLGGDPMLTLYRDADNALGAALAKVSDDDAVMIVLSHGIGPHYDGNPILDEILHRLADALRPAGRWARPREVLLERLRGAQRRLARRLAPNARHPRQVRNLDGSRAWFEVPSNDLYGAVRLNLRGREPWGQVAPGADEEAVITLLTDELMALRHAATGSPAVQRVLRTREYHDGPNVDRLPDLLIEWNWDEPFIELTSPTIGIVRSEATPLRTGDHRPYGAVFTRHLPLPDGDEIRFSALGRVLRAGVLPRA